MSLLISVIIMFMSSCASTTYLNNGVPYVTRVDHFGDYDVKGKTFYIESGDESVSNNDVEFKEYAGYCAENLKVFGAIETTDKENADICVLMNYCITDESYQETIPVPEFGRTSIASTTTKGSTTTYQYNYGTTGYHYVQNNVSNFVHVVNVYAYDNKSRDGDPVMLWKTNYKSSGSNSNIREVIPYMFYSFVFGRAYDDDNLRYVDQNDHVFNCWKQKKFSNPNFYFGWDTDAVFHSKDDTDFGKIFFYVEKKSDETIVCFLKGGCASYKISNELYIVYNGKEARVRSVDNCPLGNKFTKECGDKYLVMHFPANLDNVNTFELREYTNSSHTKYISWGTVELKKGKK